MSEHVTPDQLVQRFCVNLAPGLVGSPGPGRNDIDGYSIHRGHCGYSGMRSDDPMVVGFDGGYEFAGFLENRGWTRDQAIRDCPYVIHLYWNANPLILAEYCEGDLNILTFDTPANRLDYRKRSVKLNG